MQKLTLCLFAALLLGVLARPARSGEEAKKPVADPKAKPEGPKDIIGKVRAMHAEGKPKPPTTFKQGHVKIFTPTLTKAKAPEGILAVRMPSGAPVPTPTVAGGRVFVSGGFRSKTYHAFEADSGKRLWSIQLDDDGPSSAVVEDDVVVFNTESCTVFAVDAKTGKQLWSWWLGDPLMSTPAVHGGRVFTSYPAAGRVAASPGSPKGAAPTSHVFCALDLKTGKILWQRWIDADVMTAPVIANKRVYAATFAGTVYEFGPTDGEILSAKQHGATSSPTIVQGQMFVSRRSIGIGGAVSESFSRLRADGSVLFDANPRRAAYLDHEIQGRAEYAKKSLHNDAANGFGAGAPPAANPAQGLGNVGLGTVSSLQAFQGSRAANDGSFNYNTMGDEVVCTDPKTGKTVWKQPIAGDLKKSGGYLATSPAIAGGMLFVATLDGRVLAVNPKDGKVARTWSVGHPIRFQPAVHNGRIYLGTQNGCLVMIDTGNRAYTGWTTWGGNGAHTGVLASKAKAAQPPTGK